MRRRGYNAAVGALAVGGHLGEPVSRLIDATGRPMTPAPPDEVDLVQLEQVGELLTALDLRHGGGLVSQLAKTVLRWAVPMLDVQDMDEADRCRLHSVVGGRRLGVSFHPSLTRRMEREEIAWHGELSEAELAGWEPGPGLVEFSFGDDRW